MLLILKLMQRSDPDFSERGPGSESGEDEESDPYHCLQGVTCEECGLECRSKNALSKHIRTHQKLDCSVSISSFIYLCVSIYFSVFLPVSVSVCLSVFVCLFLSVSVYLFMSLSISPHARFCSLLLSSKHYVLFQSFALSACQDILIF